MVRITCSPPTSTTLELTSSTARSRLRPGPARSSTRSCPKGYAPFGIQNLERHDLRDLREAAAGRNDEPHGRAGASLTPSTDGRSLLGGWRPGSLNAPWGLAWAPADFGDFSGDLIVGNFGNGGLTPSRGDGHAWHPDGKLRTSQQGGRHRRPVGHRVWRREPNNGPTNTLFFAAGPNDELAERSVRSRGALTRRRSWSGSADAGPASRLARAIALNPVARDVVPGYLNSSTPQSRPGPRARC